MVKADHLTKMWIEQNPRKVPVSVVAYRVSKVATVNVCERDLTNHQTRKNTVGMVEMRAIAQLRIMDGRL